MIIGLTGPNAAGKGEVAEYLKKKGFEYHSLSDAIRDEATKRNLEHTRQNLIDLGNELRKTFGPTVLAKRIREKLHEPAVVDSIRNVYEVKELQGEKGFMLIGVTAPVEVRFERAKARGRIGDATSLESFTLQENQEKSSDEKAQQLDQCFQMADKQIVNGGTIEDLHSKVDAILPRES